MLQLALNFLFPKTCIICGKMCPNYICSICESKFEKYKKFNIIDNKKLIIDKLGIENVNLLQKYYFVCNEKVYWEKMIYCFDYKGLIRKYILKYKFNNEAYLYEFFSFEILKNKKIYELLKTYDIIIPVPMDKVKKLRRGYNQTQLITKIISNKTGIIEEECIKKVKQTKTQSLLKFEQRKENIKNAYSIYNIEKVKNKKVILFDDIFTTGSTVNEISKILKNSGVKEILVLVLAKD